MTREEEIQEAIKTLQIYYCSHNGLFECSEYIDNDIQNAFYQGAKWADNNICLSSIWNDTSIMHSDNKGIIYLTKNNKFGVLNSIKSNNWDWYVSCKYSIIKWAYISDLLPKGGEK